MGSEAICAYVYINGEIIRGPAGNTTFRGNRSKSVLLRPNMTLPDIMNVIQTAIREDGSSSTVTSLWYRWPLYQINGGIHYTAVQIINEEGVLCMFHTFAGMPRLICMELNVEIVNPPSNYRDCRYVTRFVSAQLCHDDDLKALVESTYINPEQNSAELYAITEPIPHPYPQPPRTQPSFQQPPSPQNQTQDTLDLNISYTEMLTQTASFYETTTTQPTHFFPTSPTPSQPQTQNLPPSNPIEDPIINFHEENMDDFSDHEDHELFNHNNNDSDDEDVGIPTSIPYQQPRCPVELNLDHVQHYIDHEHFVDQQGNVQLPTGALEVGMTFEDKKQCIRAIKECNIRNNVDSTTLYSDTKRLTLVCKSHEAGCSWSLGACFSKRSNKWVFKSIEGNHTCYTQMINQDHRQLDKHVIAQIIQPIVKINATVCIKTLIAEVKTFMNYTPSYKKTWLAKQRALEIIHGNWEESYNKLPKLLGALQSCVPGTVVAVQTDPVIDNGEIVPGKKTLRRLFWSFGPCIQGFAYCKPIVQVDGTWLYDKYTGTFLMATAQDGANHIFPIAYAIVEGETAAGWGFFLKNLRTHVCPQTNISLISDRHAAIISAYNNPNNLWVGDTTHFFCLRHIAQNFLRSNKNCKSLKKKVMNAGYAYIEKMHWRHLEDIRSNNPAAAQWLDDIPKKDWVQCFDEGKHWGHMTTNLAESVNSIFKGTRYLPVSSIVEDTYFKSAKLFAQRGMQTQAMINSGSLYSEVVADAINQGHQASNTHVVNSFDRHNHTFTVIETQAPLDTPRPAGRFRVMLQDQTCDCGEYQAKHLPCSHVMAACKSVNVDPMNYVPPLFTLQHILNVYDNSFGLLPDESMWAEYEENQWCHDPTKRRSAKGRPKSNRIPTEMDDQIEGDNTKKNVESVDNLATTEEIVQIYLHLQHIPK